MNAGTLDYSPPPPADGTLPFVAMLYGLASGPLAVGIVYLLDRKFESFDRVGIGALLVIVVVGSAAILALATLRLRVHTPRGVALAIVGLTSAILWAIAFVILCAYFATHID